MDKRARPHTLCRSYEFACMSAGFRSVAGVDEAGRGPLAGPVVAAAVIMDSRFDVPGVNDSKKLTPRVREELFDRIIDASVSWKVVVLSAQVVDELNILQATMRAMKDAVEGLSTSAGFVLVDGPRAPVLTVPCIPLKGGDRRCFSIAAASVLAKVERDRLMIELDERFPDYGFARHKGYGTAEHLNALARLGPTVEHRRTFAPVKALL